MQAVSDEYHKCLELASELQGSIEPARPLKGNPSRAKIIWGTILCESNP